MRMSPLASIATATLLFNVVYSSPLQAAPVQVPGTPTIGTVYTELNTPGIGTPGVGTSTSEVNVQTEKSLTTTRGKELWMTTPATVSRPAGISTFFTLTPSRHPQPPSGAHVPSPKDHDNMGDSDKEGNIHSDAASNNTAPGFGHTEQNVQGIISALDPQKQSPLNTNAPLAFKSATSPYTPNTSLFNTSAIRTPMQTNRWWQNLVIESGIDPIHPYPYMVKCLSNSSIIGFPQFQATETSMTSSQPPDWELSDSQGRLTTRQVSATDDLGVEVTWMGTSPSTFMRSRYYKGMPFLTYEMNNMAPQLKTIHAILKVEQLARSVKSDAISTGAALHKIARQLGELPSLTQLTLNDNSKWLLVSKPALQWQQGANGQLVPQGLGASSFTGYIQLAHLGDDTQNNLNVLQQYAGTYPIDATVTYTAVQGTQQSRASNIIFFYKTNTDIGGSTSGVFSTRQVPTSLQLLTFLLPHHMDNLSTANLTQQPLSGYRCTKGPLTAVAGNFISYSQPLEPVSYDGPQPIRAADQDSIQQQLLKDIVLSTNVTAPDPYFYGKGVAKVARLYQIAQEINDIASAATLRDKLVALLTPWLTSQTNSDPLVYDSTWGGVVSTKGLSDPSADFGQGRYNDHHFHYGYFIYAGAILAHHDINAFAQFREPLNQMLRDYANPSYADSCFPFMRHFDPYDGHSWAAGLFTFGDGRNQESTGEAINAYYAAFLYAKALGLDETADFYEIILNMEAASGRRYWHPTLAQAKAQYLAPFTHNVVGIVWSSKVDYATFFGADPEFIYGIQMLPFTPATKLLLKPDWVKEAWCPDGSTCAGGMKPAAAHAGTSGWAQFLYTAYSLVDRATALNNVASCSPDDGNTLTNVLHWIATCGQQVGGS
ncbi:glycoside hydrolase [Martensiomyces pterosporus]|nr:glycoside hydrolase [Martensiomyces pterosporus]